MPKPIFKTWGEMKERLLTVHQELLDQNGVPYCKNCGCDYEALVENIESLFLNDSSQKETN